ncbi:uncharacterized protein PpBr36_10041 [Pyricularia pennisetigena]|uniref:uncharacterized protein n=1 Tax=Pyricularia pennisetigena TaxID=1578925 RepID=UPI00114DD6C7|nr:uncharacterized protein PpBr36_10041 [Pyricularia pennisetigena]TLS22475.1 hypothetical protein PpBr36_10041 [Pyricularia pennisetigena]
MAARPTELGASPTEIAVADPTTRDQNKDREPVQDVDSGPGRSSSTSPSSPVTSSHLSPLDGHNCVEGSATGSSGSNGSDQFVTALQSAAPSIGAAKASSDSVQVLPDVVQPLYISGPKLFAMVSSATLATFLTLLDMSIIATAIPHITSEFSSLDDVGWYGSAYQLASAVLHPVSSRLYTYINLKWTFLTFLVLFEGGSLICGLASSSFMLIVGRAVAGMGSSGLMGGGLSIIAGAVPIHKRPCFYINLPAGGLCIFLMAFLMVPEQVPKLVGHSFPSRGHIYLTRRFDFVGFMLIAGGSVMLLLALEFGGKTHPWDSSVVIGLICGAAGAFVVFGLWMHRFGDEALIPSSFTAAFFLPIYFQSVKGATPVMSGVYTLPTVLGQLLFSVLSGLIIPKMGYYIPVAAVGAAVSAVGCGMLSTLSPVSTAAQWAGYQFIAGAGRGLYLQIPILAVQSYLQPCDLSIGMSTIVFAQTLGAAIVLVIGSSVFLNSLRHEIPVAAPDVDLPEILKAGATGFRQLFEKNHSLPGIIISYTLSLQRVFYVVTAIACLAFLSCWGMGWKNIKQKKAGTAEEVESGVVLNDRGKRRESQAQAAGHAIESGVRLSLSAT